MLTAGILSLALFIGSVGLCAGALHGALPPFGWTLLAGTAVFILGWAGVLAIMVARRVGHDELVRVWSRLAATLIVGSQFACLGLIWGVLPFVSTSAQLLMALPVMGCVPTQMICSPENSLVNRVGAVGVLGSLALFFATRGTQPEAFAALYVAGFGVIMFILGDRLAGVVRAAVAARLASEALAARLDRMLAEVADQRDAQTRFMASASHDLGQPLAAASLFFDQSQRASDELARARAAEGVRRAFAAADQLLSHMLGYLRLKADAVEVHRSRTSARGVAAKVIALHAAAATAAGVELRLVGRDAILLIDPSLAERALSNLIDNAINHARADRILVGVRRTGKQVRLWVIDDGTGVAPVDAEHIFNDYYQADAGGAVRRGFGLGLASVRRLTVLMEGSAGHDRRWLHGAAFYLEFCAAPSLRSDGIAA